MEKISVLVVERESSIRMAVRVSLEKNGYQILEAENEDEALDIFLRNKRIALIIIDIMISQMNCWEVIREMRSYSKVPILVLAAKSEEQNVLRGFALGVDAYICKPFTPKILAARVAAIIRRTNAFSADFLLKAGAIEIDRGTRHVTVDGKNVELKPKEFELLLYFVENNGIALSREQILNHVWNYNYYGGTRTVDTHVRKLRSKIGKAEYIKTVWGIGYKFKV